MPREVRFDPAGLRNGIEKLKAESESADFYKDMENVKRVGKQLRGLEDKLESYESAVKAGEEVGELIELAEEAEDATLLPDILKLLAEFERVSAAISLSTLLRGDYDTLNAVVSIHAGAGGTEAQDWADMLFRMYKRYCEREGYKVKLYDYLEGDGAGIKSVTFLVEGTNVYGYLKAEKGVHRLVRISPFDSNSRRHTSFASVEVIPEIENDGTVEIRQEDLKIDTYRSGGAGGQHVNKTESAIRITHIPSGIVVQCQNERSQIQNRETAMRMLQGKLLEVLERENMEKAAAIKGAVKKIEWGSQIRSYVFHPYSMVKDHRTGFETADVTGVMDGDIQGFIEDYLRKSG